MPKSDVSAALEIIRRVLQPKSRSLPHITVRFSNRDLDSAALQHYRGVDVGDLIIGRPRTFDDPNTIDDGTRTLVLSCDSESLEWLSYKPDFPQSVFHLTLYEGPASHFVAEALRVLSSFPWGLRFSRTLGEMEALGSRPLREYVETEDKIVFTVEAADLFERICRDRGIPLALDALSDAQRLQIVRAAATAIHESAETLRVPESNAALDQAVVSNVGQAVFWTENEVNKLSGSQGATLSPSNRKNSTYLTPPEVAIDMAQAALEHVRGNQRIHFGDPAIGPGIFYAALRRSIDPLRITSATGVELEPQSAALTAHRWRRTGLKVTQGDFLLQSPHQDAWSVVLANPPYLRSQKLSEVTRSLRTSLSEEIGIHIDGRADLYVYFLLAAHRWMAPGAVAAWLLPAEFLVSDYGKAVRTYLSSTVRLRQLHSYSGKSPVFDNALVSSVVVLFENTQPEASQIVRLTSGGTISRPVSTSNVSVGELQGSKRWSGAYLSRRSITRSQSTTPLGALFQVQRGIATGSNASFVLTQEKVLELGVERRWLKPLLPRATTLPGNVVHAKENGDPDLAVYPWLVDTPQSLAEIEAESPRFADFLRAEITRVGSRTLVSRRQPPYRQDRQHPPLFAFVYMAKKHRSGANRFILNNSNAVVLNNYLAMQPKAHLSEWLTEDPGRVEYVHSLLCGIGSDHLEAFGRPYIGDLLKLEPGDLLQLEIPTPNW